MKILRWILGGLLVVAAIVGHWAFHYMPRARPAAPWADSPVAGLLESNNFPAAVWVPYPHQNLAYLRGIADTQPDTLRAVARLAGLPSPSLPTFGPLALPPSSEIAVAADETGERFAVMAQVYPAFGSFAKLAGRVAGNPWLAGGEIVVDGRSADVSWDGNRWMVISEGLSPEVVAESPASGSTEDPVASREEGIGWIRVRQAVDPLPAGLYRLWGDDGGLGIRSQSGGSTGPAVAADDRQLIERFQAVKLFLLVFSGGQPALGEPSQALAFFDQVEEKIKELPRIASLHEAGGERWSLPGESLLELAGRKPYASTEGSWDVAALDSTSLEQVRAVAPLLDELSSDPLAWGLWLDLEGGLAEVERIAQLLSEVPIVPRRRVERWNDARTVLTPLANRYSHLAAVVTEEPRRFELRLTSKASN
ncbi:MAG: hypothetical protein AAF560_15570 [Acidobacteriota bacterium]